jgi:CubicO group peptidase (beta-lactamase class C family)
MIVKAMIVIALSGLSGLLHADDQAAADRLIQRLTQAGETESMLFWPQEDRRIAFRMMNRISPTRTVVAGGDPFPLEPAPLDLSDVTYQVDGETYRLTDHLQKKALVGIIVVKDGEVLMEHYAPGNDEESVWISFSVTKSVTSMLIGAAIQDGFIESVDEPVVNYLPRLRGTGYEKATIRNVLNMASGIRWDETYADPESDVAAAGGANGLELVTYLGTLPTNAKPGAKFNYNTGETNLVGEILRAAIGNNAATYLTHKIWQPFGMGSDAYWSLGEPGGGELGGCCISATLRDYARLGLFALRDGRLTDGTQVLPERWMSESVTSSAAADFYGYLWWLFGDRGYSALGIFGQMIRVYPEDNLVIAVHSNAEAAVDTDYHEHHRTAVEAIRDFVVATD